MNKLLLIFLCIFCTFGYAQTYNISTGGSHSTCSGTFVDSGGTGADYSISESYTITFCPSTAGQAIQLNFTAFDTESGFDVLNIYDGNSTGASLLGSYSGGSPGIVTGTTANATGCLTIEFTSDSSVTEQDGKHQ